MSQISTLKGYDFIKEDMDTRRAEMRMFDHKSKQQERCMFG